MSNTDIEMRIYDRVKRVCCYICNRTHLGVQFVYMITQAYQNQTQPMQANILYKLKNKKTRISMCNIVLTTVSWLKIKYVFFILHLIMLLNFT